MSLSHIHTDELINELKKRTYDCFCVVITREDLEEMKPQGVPTFVSPVAWNADCQRAFKRWDDENSMYLVEALQDAWKNSEHKIDPELQGDINANR